MKTRYLRKDLFLCDNKMAIRFGIFVDFPNYLNYLYIKLQGKEKLFLNIVDHITAFKMKLTLFISQLENEKMRQI